jgi:hypothetical protein
VIGRLRELARRKQALAARSAAQRATLAAALQPVASRLAMLDRIVQSVRQRPVLVAAAAVALVLLGPRRLLPWALRAAPFIALLRRG